MGGQSLRHRIKLTGQLQGLASPKDCPSRLRILTVKGGTNAVSVLRPAPPLSCTGKGTITNMGASWARRPRSSVRCAMDRPSATSGGARRSRDEEHELLTADPESTRPSKYFSRVVRSIWHLEPISSANHDLARRSPKSPAAVVREGHPDNIRWPCRLVHEFVDEDISRFTDFVQLAHAHGIRRRFVSRHPGSEQSAPPSCATVNGEIPVRRGPVLSNASGFASSWEAGDIKPGTRHDRHLVQPHAPANDASANARFRESEIVPPYALAGRLSFNPMTDTWKPRRAKSR